MFLAIVAEVNDSTNPANPKSIKVIPIRTGKLDEEVMSRIKLPILSTRGQVEEALRKALQEIELDTKMQTTNLPLGYT